MEIKQQLDIHEFAEKCVRWQMDTGKFITSKSGERAPVIPLEVIEDYVRTSLHQTIEHGEKCSCNDCYSRQQLGSNVKKIPAIPVQKLGI